MTEVKRLKEEKGKGGKFTQCYTCHQMGHIAKNCPHRFGEWGRGRGSNNPQFLPALGWGQPGFAAAGPTMQPPINPAMWMGPTQPQFNRAYHTPSQGDRSSNSGEEENSGPLLALPWHDNQELAQFVQPTVSQEKSIQLTRQRGALYVPVTMHGQNIPWLLDTGATRSIMSEGLYRRYKRSIGPLHPSPVHVVGATREELELTGETPL